jgi:hypothetical protein
MHFTTVVKLVLQDSPETPLANVKVGLFDRDLVSKDDPLGTAVTDAAGEARFQYTSEQFVDLDDKLTGSEFPDLYAVVYDARDQVVLSTRSDVIPNTARKKITVQVTRELASQHGLTAG